MLDHTRVLRGAKAPAIGEEQIGGLRHGDQEDALRGAFRHGTFSYRYGTS
jgi:hypothetical protein